MKVCTDGAHNHVKKAKVGLTINKEERLYAKIYSGMPTDSNKKLIDR